MRWASSLAVVLAVVLGSLWGGGCEDATLISPTGTPVSEGGAGCGGDGNCTASNVTCGALTCLGGEQYCAVTVAGCGDASAGTTAQKSYACPLLPVTCGAGAGCACLGALAAGCACVEQSGTPVVTCCSADGGLSDASSDGASTADGATSDGSSD